MSLVGRRRRGDLNIGFVSSQPVEPGSGPGELHQLLSQNGRSVGRPCLLYEYCKFPHQTPILLLRNARGSSHPILTRSDLPRRGGGQSFVATPRKEFPFPKTDSPMHTAGLASSPSIGAAASTNEGFFPSYNERIELQFLPEARVSKSSRGLVHPPTHEECSPGRR
jgi:hypothetical protein